MIALFAFLTAVHILKGCLKMSKNRIQSTLMICGTSDLESSLSYGHVSITFVSVVHMAREGSILHGIREESKRNRSLPHAVLGKYICTFKSLQS